MIDCVKLQPHHFVFNSATNGAFLYHFDPKKFFGIYLCRQSTLVLEVQSYLLVFNSAKFWAFFGLFGAVFGSIALSCFFETFPCG